MSTAFQTMASVKGDWAKLSFINEIVLAYNERRLAARESMVRWTGETWETVSGVDLSSTLLTGGEDVAARAFFGGMQDWVVASIGAGVWVNPDAAAVTVFDLASFYTAAGMDPAGWRRAREWAGVGEIPTWLDEGVMQARDIIQWWIAEDLQAAFSAMRWTRKIGGHTEDAGFGATAATYADVAAAWPGLTWQSSPIYFGLAAWIDTFGSGPWSVIKERGKVTYTTPGWVDKLDSVQLHGQVIELPQGAVREFLTFEAPGAEDAWITLDELSAPFSTSSIYTDSTMIGDSAAIIPDPGTHDPGWTMGWQVIGYGVEKWDFTNRSEP